MAAMFRMACLGERVSNADGDHEFRKMIALADGHLGLSDFQETVYETLQAETSTGNGQ
jgi:hypothetical protein